MSKQAQDDVLGVPSVPECPSLPANHRLLKHGEMMEPEDIGLAYVYPEGNWQPVHLREPYDATGWWVARPVDEPKCEKCDAPLRYHGELARGWCDECEPPHGSSRSKFRGASMEPSSLAVLWDNLALRAYGETMEAWTALEETYPNSQYDPFCEDDVLNNSTEVRAWKLANQKEQYIGKAREEFAALFERNTEANER